MLYEVITHLCWGGSYLVNDVYRRFVRPDADARHYVLVVLDNSATAMTGFQPHPGTGRTASGMPGTEVRNNFV